MKVCKISLVPTSIVLSQPLSGICFYLFIYLFIYLFTYDPQRFK